MTTPVSKAQNSLYVCIYLFYYLFILNRTILGSSMSEEMESILEPNLQLNVG